MEPVINATRFDASGNWAVPPEPWADQVEDRLTAAKMATRILAAIDDLPPRQKEVVTLREVQGMSSAGVCRALGISQANQRVLLRRSFEAHLAGCPDCPEYLAQMRAIIALAGSITPDDLAPHMCSDLTLLYRRWQADDTLGNPA